MGDVSLPYFFENIMEFKLIDNLKFVNVDMTFLKKLREVSNEVYYKESDYSNKPYLGILLSSEKYKYVLPLTSAKEKHKTWKIESGDRFLITEIVNKNVLHSDDIWIDFNGDTNLVNPVRHIISAIDLKKMIPIVDSAINEIKIPFDANDDEETKKYKDLLRKEYEVCIKIIDKIISKASKVYDKQTNTKNGLKFCCDFKALEKVVDNYNK